MSWWYMMRNNVGLERKESLDNPIQDVSLEHLILQEERNNKLKLIFTAEENYHLNFT